MMDFGRPPRRQTQVKRREIVAFKTTPEFKRVLEAAAEAEHKTITRWLVGLAAARMAVVFPEETARAMEVETA